MYTLIVANFAFKPQKVNFPSKESRPASSSRPSQILLTVCLFPETFQAYFGWSCNDARAVILMHLVIRNCSTNITPFIFWPPLCRKMQPWYYNILNAVNNDVIPKQVYELTLNATVLELPCSFDKYCDHFNTSGYCFWTNGSILKHRYQSVCGGCVLNLSNRSSAADKVIPLKRNNILWSWNIALFALSANADWVLEYELLDEKTNPR